MALVELKKPVSLFEEHMNFVPIANTSRWFAFVRPRRRDWNCSCFNRVV